MTEEPTRNSPCPCGSGIKYKHCCLGKPAQSSGKKKIKIISLGLALVPIIVGVAGSYYWGWETAAQISVGGIMAGLGYLILAKPPSADRNRSSGGNIDFGK